MGSTPNAPAVSRALSRETWAPWTGLAALPPAFGQLTSRLGPEPLPFPTRPLSIAVHSQATGHSETSLRRRETESCRSRLLKLSQILVFPFHPLHGYPLSPNQGRFKHKLDYVTHLLSIPSVPAMVARLTQ